MRDKKVIINVAKTEKGFSGGCDLLPGWIVTSDGDIEDFLQSVKESIDFYLDCAKKDNEKYPAIFDEDYEISLMFTE